MGLRRCFLLTGAASIEVGSHEKNKTYQFKVHQSSINCNSLGTIFYSTPSRIHRTFSLSKNVVPNTFMVYQFLLWFIIFITIKVNIVEGILRYTPLSDKILFNAWICQCILKSTMWAPVTSKSIHHIDYIKSYHVIVTNSCLLLDLIYLMWMDFI